MNTVIGNVSRGDVVDFVYNGERRVVSVDNVFDNRIIGYRESDGYKAYRFDRMENPSLIRLTADLASTLLPQ